MYIYVYVLYRVVASDMAELKYSAQGQRRREVNDANCGIAKIPNPIQFFSFFPHCCCYSCGFCRFLLTHLYLLFNIFFLLLFRFVLLCCCWFLWLTTRRPLDHVITLTIALWPLMGC